MTYNSFCDITERISTIALYCRKACFAHWFSVEESSIDLSDLYENKRVSNKNCRIRKVVIVKRTSNYESK